MACIMDLLDALAERRDEVLGQAGIVLEVTLELLEVFVGMPILHRIALSVIQCPPSGRRRQMPRAFLGLSRVDGDRAMARRDRAEVVVADEVGVDHCVRRAVRGA